MGETTYFQKMHYIEVAELRGLLTRAGLAPEKKGHPETTQL